MASAALLNFDAAQSYRYQHGRYSYVSNGRCQGCGSGPQPVVNAPKGLALCRGCLETCVDVIDQAALKFDMPCYGVPLREAPPVQDVWLVMRSSDVRVGMARLARETGKDLLEIHDPVLFRDTLSDPRIDVDVFTWRGMWTERDVGNVHHVRKENPHELLGRRRYAIVLPDDSQDGVVTVSCRRVGA